MVLRPKFLIHWTHPVGQAQQEYGSPASDDERRAYLDILLRILGDGSDPEAAGGFKMSIPNGGVGERLYAHGGIEGVVPHPLVSFTEIRLSAAETHATRYGRLGIGVAREYVLRRHGGMVRYVQRPADLLVSQLVDVQRTLETVTRLTKSEHGDLALEAERSRGRLGLVLGYLRAMEEDGRPLIEEQEWRVVHSYHAQDRDHLIRAVPTSPGEHDFYLVTRPKEVEVLVFPDTDTMHMTLVDPTFTAWAKVRGSLPAMMTLDQCRSF